MLKVNLSRDAMLKAGFISELVWRGKGQDRYLQEKLHLDERSISVYDDGTVYLMDGDLLYQVPEVFEKFVSSASYYDNFGYGLRPYRQLGEYHLHTAVADLSAIGSGHYHVKIRAKNLDDLRELYHLIRQGEIWPAKDYEAQQVPPPCQNLKNLVAEAWQLIRRNISDRLCRIKDRITSSAA